MKFVIAVGSTSENKVEAAKIACQCVRIEAEVVAIAAESGVPSQPYGVEEIARGAKNRADVARKERTDAWALGIESGVCYAGIDAAGYPMSPVDIAAIALIEPNGREWLIWSETLDFPPEDVRAALERGNGVTVGDILAEQTGCAPDDPHFYLTGQGRSRIDYLADAIEKIFRFAGLPRSIPQK